MAGQDLKPKPLHSRQASHYASLLDICPDLSRGSAFEKKASPYNGNVHSTLCYRASHDNDITHGIIG